jgi:hypothetical protein
MAVLATGDWRGVGPDDWAKQTLEQSKPTKTENVAAFKDRISPSPHIAASKTQGK